MQLRYAVVTFFLLWGGSLLAGDPITGAATSRFGVGGFGPVTEIEYRDDGTLFAAGGGLGGGAGMGAVSTIDPDTGAGTIVGQTGFLALSGLSFVPSVGVGFTITAAFSGAWFDPTQEGHGFLFQVLPGGVMIVYWFTYDSQGNPTWFFGVGEIEGNSVTFDLLWEPDGPSFPPAFDPADFNPVPWGTLIVVFFDCDNGMASWDSDVEEYGKGEMDLERITNTDTLECEI